MSRPLAGFTPELTALSARREPLLELDLHVVTPLFGGGANAREVDRERPVNAKSVRGHLRFWWRACRGAQFANVQDLFQAEAKIWGSTELPASVEVEIETLKKGRPIRWADYKETYNKKGQKQISLKRDPNYPAYALFPFQGEIDKGVVKQDASGALKDVQFHLCLTGPEMHRAEVEAAVWAWIMFGGVGARTRRGCGTLSCTEERFRPNLGALVDVAGQHLRQGGCRLPIPLLHQARILLGPPVGAANGQRPEQKAWVKAIEAMQEFRQGYDIGRKAGPGQSFWPEPDSIRDMTNIWTSWHIPIFRGEQFYPIDGAGRFYPRADLGLPIVFKFKDSQDPPQQTLQAQGDKMTRMASPIILKALPLTKTTAVPMALLLNAPHVWDADTPQVGFGNGTLPMNELHDAAKSHVTSPMRGKDTAREAFMDFAKSKWGGLEVTLP